MVQIAVVTSAQVLLPSWENHKLPGIHKLPLPSPLGAQYSVAPFIKTPGVKLTTASIASPALTSAHQNNFPEDGDESMVARSFHSPMLPLQSKMPPRPTLPTHPKMVALVMGGVMFSPQSTQTFAVGVAGTGSSHWPETQTWPLAQSLLR